MNRPWANFEDETLVTALEWSIVRMETVPDRHEQTVLADIGSIVVEQLIRIETNE